MNSKISILILAAGASSRMGKVKQLLPWGTVSIIEHLVSTSLATDANSVYTVLGAHRDQIAPKLKNYEVTVLENENWERGMGNSIAVGVEGILNAENPDGILILLADQPLIDIGYINMMIQTFLNGNSGIIGTEYIDKIGVPALFGSRYYTDLLNLEGDVGAAKIIKNQFKDCSALNPGGKHLDVDTNDDYQHIRSDN